MENAWKHLDLRDYEAHMQLESVQQLQALNRIMKQQVNQYAVDTIAVLGVAGGNGLEHVMPLAVSEVYGIDVNDTYLQACKTRFEGLGERLILRHMDLTDREEWLPCVDLMIANLLIEYVGIETFVYHMARAKPKLVSCVIQNSCNEQFVSNSPYLHAFDAIAQLHTDIGPDELINAMLQAGYALCLREEYPLPNGKEFIRMDYKLQ